MSESARRYGPRVFTGTAAVLLCLHAAAGTGDGPPAADTLRWFQATEQALMDSVAPGDKGPWERMLDPSCVLTDEEGRVMTKQEFLDALRPLPPGLSGGIAVKDLTVQDLGGVVVVRYLADEWEMVFGQRLTTRYRTTNTYRRVAPDWRMVASHTSVVTQDPPTQAVSRAAWPSLVGRYRLLPDGWTFTVELRDGDLYGGRDAKDLRLLIPLTPEAFVLSGSLGEWIFVTENGKGVRIVNFRKFEPLVWTRVDDPS